MVQTGIGLTGKMWAHEHFGLTPDALAFGKKMIASGKGHHEMHLSPERELA